MEIRYNLNAEHLEIEVEAGYLHIAKVEIPLKDLAEALKSHIAPVQRGRPKKEDLE